MGWRRRYAPSVTREGEQVHGQDFVKAYEKLEPYVSLDFDETVMKESFEVERKSWVIEIIGIRTLSSNSF